MLSGEGNAGERWKTTIGLISKKTTLHVQHTFLYISLLLFCTTTTWNFQKLLSYMFYGGNVVPVLVHFFFHCCSFSLCIWWPLAFPILSLPLQNFHVVLPTKKCLRCFLSLALDLCHPFSHWASPACHLLSLLLKESGCLKLGTRHIITSVINMTGRYLTELVYMPTYVRVFRNFKHCCPPTLL